MHSRYNPAMTRIFQHGFDNGLVLAAERVPGAQSLAMTMMIPAGVTAEPNDQQGVAQVLSEMICRGAGDLDAREHSDALDQLGVQRSVSADTSHLSIGATMLGDKLPDALPLITDMVRSPLLQSSSLDPSRDLALQAIDGLDDEPQQKVFIELRRKHFPHPFDRTSLGRREHIAALSLEQVRSFWQSTAVAHGAIITFAGNFDWSRLLDQVDRQLGDWAGRREDVAPGAEAQRGYHHIKADTAQVHIGLAYDAVPEPDPQSVVQRVGAAVLSGGMSGRLFTEVRERHGLCYAVYASYGANKHLGAMLSYAGTTAPRAQKTYDILTRELRRISEGVDESEYHRAVVGMKSSLVMQGESTHARARALASDLYIYGRPRRLDQRIDEVEAVTLDKLNDYLRDHPAGDMTCVTIGPEPLNVT